MAAVATAGYAAMRADATAQSTAIGIPHIGGAILPTVAKWFENAWAVEA